MNDKSEQDPAARRGETEFIALLAGTDVIPTYGRPLLDVDTLERIADQLRGGRIPMQVEHDLDRPIEARIIDAEVREAEDGVHNLHVTFAVPDDAANLMPDRQGMSIAFSGVLIPAEPGESEVGVFASAHFSYAELVVAAERLKAAGFNPSAGAYFQLSVLPPPVVLLDVAQSVIDHLPAAVLAHVLVSAVGVFLHRDQNRPPTKFRIRIDGGRATAEIETSSDRALREALNALGELRGETGPMIRDKSRKRWRKAGHGRRGAKKR